MRRPEIPAQLIDPSLWPGVDASALEEPRRAVYLQREQAVRGYLQGAPLAQIERHLGVDRGTLRRLVERCLMPHPDGRIQGLRALMSKEAVKTGGMPASMATRCVCCRTIRSAVEKARRVPGSVARRGPAPHRLRRRETTSCAGPCSCADQ